MRRSLDHLLVHAQIRVESVSLRKVVSMYLHTVILVPCHRITRTAAVGVCWFKTDT